MSEFLSYVDFLHGLEVGLRVYYQQKINDLPTSNTKEQLISALDHISLLIKSELANEFKVNINTDHVDL